MDKKIKDLQVVVDRIKKDEGVAYGILADIKVLNNIRKKVTGKLAFPEEFYALTHLINGIRNDSAELYAFYAKGKSGYFTDIVKANKKNRSLEKVFLGETEFDYLVYLPAKSTYELHDRVSGAPVAIFSKLTDVLVYLF